MSGLLILVIDGMVEDEGVRCVREDRPGPPHRVDSRFRFLLVVVRFPEMVEKDDRNVELLGQRLELCRGYVLRLEGVAPHTSQEGKVVDEHNLHLLAAYRFPDLREVLLPR